jgi:hypothetical protein
VAAAVTRRTVIGRAAMGGAALLGAGGLAAGRAAAGEDDLPALRLALGLEHLQERLYAHAARAESVGPPLLAFARAAVEHERAHVAALRSLLGSAAPDLPEADVWRAAVDDTAFTRTAVRLEDLAVRLLNGLAARLPPRAVAETARIAAVDARHGAWLRDLAGEAPGHHVRDGGLGAGEVAGYLERMGLAPGTAL